MQIETFSQTESTGDAQEKQVRSYELAFAENKKLVNSKVGVHLFLTMIYMLDSSSLFSSLTNQI